MTSCRHAKQKYKYQQLWILNKFMAANELCLFLLKLFFVYYLHVTFKIDQISNL